ncbi:MAG TPA: hypothetical protein DCZ91_01055 [Lachnospiraceae bacterium]|jgi:hypothetical protein|nr:hypothetical protein [Lachnospiraceae bacterium]
MGKGGVMAETERKERPAREIVALMGHKALFEYMPEMEISVPDTDRRNSLDKIAYYYRSEEIVLSDLYIGYVIALYKYTIPKVVAESIQVLGGFWPQKRVPRYIDRDALLSRIKKMCSMGMLRRFVYVKDGNNIVLYSTTPEFCKVIYQALKLNTDARHEKDILPPLEIVEKAASSLVTNELMKSPYLKEFDFMPSYQDKDNGKMIFNSRIVHEIGGKMYVTVVEPMFTRVDLKRFTESEWQKFLKKKVLSLKGYMEQLNGEGNIVQLIIVCEDLDDFRQASSAICTVFPESMLAHVYYTSEGAVKSAGYDLKNSLVRVTSVKNGESGMKVLETVSSQWAYPFF